MIKPCEIWYLKAMPYRVKDENIYILGIYKKDLKAFKAAQI